MSDVYWHSEKGAICPRCEAEKTPVRSSPPWENGIKIRYHKCACGQMFKSIQLSEPAKQGEIEQRLAKIGAGLRTAAEEREILNRILNYS